MHRRVICVWTHHMFKGLDHTRKDSAEPHYRANQNEELQPWYD